MSDTANAEGYPTQGTIMPDLEDINQDNNLSESEAYFQYHVSMRPNDLQVGKNFVTNVQLYQNGTKTERWYQFKIPIREFEKKVNGIQDFRSIRFMRMFMKDFDEEVLLRFARLELIRGEWRRYMEDLTQPGESVQTDPNLTSFNIAAVNVEENDQRSPIKYEIPPGIVREVDPSQTYQRQLNEQSLVLDVCNLQDGDARAAYRNVQFDVRTYKKLKMFVHAEEVLTTLPFNNEDLTLFVRLGTDFSDNYYEYEMPLNKTEWGATLAEDIWPEANNVEIIFDNLLNLKKKRNELIDGGNTAVSYVVEYIGEDPENQKRRLKVKGSPNLQGIKTLMVGVRNPSKTDVNPWQDAGEAECAIIWINELRLTDFISEGGSAAVAQMQVQLADFANVSMSGNYSGVNWGSIESRVQDRQRNEKIGVDMNANVQLGQFFGRQAGVSLPFFYGYSLGLINPEYDPFNPDVRLRDYDLATRKEKAKAGQDFNERKSYNFTNVRKEAKAGSTPHFWRVSNWSASYAYSENLRRDFNTNFDKTKTWNGGLNYNYSFTVKPFEPFKKVKFVQKSKWLAIVKDFNLFLTPKNISFTNDVLRSYNERQVRNNMVPDYEFEPVYVKRFNWNRNYNIGYDLTKNLKATFTAANRSIFEEGNGRVDRKEDPSGYQDFKDTIRSQMSSFGKTMDYSHNYSINYTLPLDKFPATDWMSANFKYGGTYNWQRAPLGQSAFGNTIQNNRSVNVTGQMNLTNLYNKIPFLKKVNSDGKGGRGAAASKDVGGRNITEAKPKEEAAEPEKPESEMTEKEKKKAERKKEKEERRKEADKKRGGKAHPVAGFFARVIMSVRNISGTYALNDGTLLPGYNEETSVLGFNNSFSAPLGGFVFGQQRYDLWGKETGFNIATTAAENGWLVKNQDLNKQYTTTHSQNLNLRASLEPIKDVAIELTMTRTFGNNSSEFFRWDESAQRYESQSKVETGTLTYSNVSIGSAFTLIGSEYQSATFDKLLSNRQLVSELLGQNNSNSAQLTSGYFKGYSGTQQEVVTGAFLTSYTNRGISEKNVNPVKNMPLPNWSVNYNGLTKFKFAKKMLKNFVLRHAYNSTVSVSGLQTNLNATFDDNGDATAFDINNNYIADRQLQNITITERFAPLLGFDATWNIKGQGLITKFEYKKDRSATLSLNNNQVTEVNGKEWVIGLGYKFAKVKLPFEKIQPSDINIRFDLSVRDNLTIIRKIVENTNQATAGQRVVSIKSSADYNVTKNLTLQLYYDQVINTPKIATSFPTGNMSCGIRLRFNLAGVQ
jgi:cell surface protein SprA